MIDKEGRGSDRRNHKRYYCIGEVKVHSPQTGGMLPGKIVDLSSDGCLMKLHVRSVYESGWTIEVCFRSSYLAFRTMGTVCRCEEDGSLLGIQFQALSARGRMDVDELMKDMKEAEQRVTGSSKRT